MNKLIFRNIILSIFCFTFNMFLNSNTKSDTNLDTHNLNKNNLSIEVIKNLSKHEAVIINDNSKILINSNKKKIFLNSIEIPFVSIKSYIKKFIKDIPYVPQESLRIIHKDNLFHIWQNELGVIWALDPNDPEKLSDWKSNIIYSFAKNNIKFMLLIGKHGNLCLKPIKPVS